MEENVEMENISEMTDEQLVKEYVERNEVANVLKMEQDLLKEEIKTRLVDSGREKFYCDYGMASYNSHMRNQFVQAIAKRLLTEQKEVVVLKVMSKDAMEKQADFLRMKEETK